MKGRKPVPTHLRVIKGNPSRRPLRRPPAPARSSPTPPSHLSASARIAYLEIVGLASSLGTLASSDAIALEGCAGALDDLRTSRAALALELTEVGPDGVLVTLAAAGARTYRSGALYRARPEIAHIADAERRLSSWLSKLGLTPVDRERVTAYPRSDENPFAEFSA